MFENHSDSKLFDQIKAGDSQALSVLFNKYYQQLCRFVFVFLPENEVVEELVANVFINLWENKNQIVVYSSLKAYLYRSAKNQAISHLRKQKTTVYLIDEYFDLSDKQDTTPEAIYIENELNIEFVRAFQKLPPRAKLAFKLHRFDGLKYVEIAEIMNISVSAVEKNITSALKILHHELVSMTKVH
jgi:RNA polymerase sigma-70 factor (ECF subfamily)